MIDLIPIDESEPLDGAAAALAEQMALDLMLLRRAQWLCSEIAKNPHDTASINGMAESLNFFLSARLGG